MSEQSVTPEFTDEQARTLIRATSNYARHLAGPYLNKRSNASPQEVADLQEAKAIDEARFVLEAAVDEAQK